MKSIMDMSDQEFNLFIRRIMLFSAGIMIPIMILTFIIAIKNILGAS